MNNFDLEKAKEQDLPTLDFALGMRAKDPIKSIEILSRLASEGSVISMIALGDLFAYGRYGISPEPDKAKRYFLNAKHMGSMEAPYRLGRYFEYLGDFASMSEEYHHLMDKRFILAYVLMGVVYYEGYLIEKNNDRALEYFEAGARLGHVHAKKWVSHINRCSGNPLRILKGVLQYFPAVFAHMVEIAKDPDSELLRLW